MRASIRSLSILSILLIVPVTVHTENLEFCLLAQKAQAENKPALAIDRYTRCLTKGDLGIENKASAHNKRGIVYANERRYARAVADFSQAVKLVPAYADAYFNRGRAYARQGRIKQAVTDFSETIRLKPNESGAYIGRAAAYLYAGQYDWAIADYDAVIRLRPKLAAAYESRAQSLFYKGAFARAAADFRQALSINPKNEYSVLWLYVSQARAKDHSAGKTLTQSVRNLDTAKWPEPVIRYYLGKISAQQLFDQARHADSNKDRIQLCEAYFYIGQKRLVQGDLPTATDLFDRAITHCPADFLESTSAKVEKARLGR